MKLNNIFAATRVPVWRPILVAAVLASSGLASSDPRGATAVEPGVAVAVEPAVSGAPLENLAAAETASSMWAAASWAGASLGSVNTDVFEIALRAAAKAIARGDAPASTLTVIDFSRPSTERRMWVYDLRSRTLLFEELVSHGRNSGHNLATAFSNVAESNKSSIGLYRAAESYIGKHGYSLRLDGLERGFNDRARERAIVIHGAEYVSEKIAKAQGRLGRSLGCPAVRPEVSRKLIDAVKNGGLVFAYYPDQQWLNTSEYVN